MNAADAVLASVRKSAARYTTIVSHFPPRPVPGDTGKWPWGAMSITCPNRKERYILASSEIEVAPGLIETPSGLARHYLLWKYKRGPRQTSTQWEILLSREWSMPLYITPARWGEEGEYIDIQSAWPSILMLWGWDVDWWPNRWLQLGLPPADFPFWHEKRARSCLVSIAHTRALKMFDPRTGEFEKRITFNQLYHPGLFAVIGLTLSVIARECVNAGAVYWNTDGCIAPTRVIGDKIKSIIAAWGMAWSVKRRGSGQAWCSGGYRFDVDVISQRRPAPTGRSYDGIGAKDAALSSWLKTRWEWARRQGRVPAIPTMKESGQ